MSGFFQGLFGQKKKRRPLPFQEKADPLEQDLLAEKRKRAVLSQGGNATILSPLTGDSTVGSTLLVGR